MMDLSFYIPVVIFNGNMFEAYLNDDDNIILESMNHIVYKFNYSSPVYPNNKHLVDILTYDELENLKACFDMKF